MQAATIQTLEQKVASAQANGEAAKAAEQVASAAAAQAQASVEEQMHALHNK